MIGYGKSFGAITVINAMPCGIGATIGTAMETHAVFSEAADLREQTVLIANDPLEDDLMARLCVESAYRAAGAAVPAGWRLEIDSEIPVSRGLKSSSSACNAIVSAVFDALGAAADPTDMIRIGVDCARKAGVTVTGSFDDACGCHFGGFVITDNTADRILSQTPDFGVFDVVICVPEKKIRKGALPLGRLRAAAPQMRRVIELAEKDPFAAMVQNGALIAGILGEDNSPADRAMACGALGAGMTGSGPAVSIVVEKGKARSFIREMDVPGADILTTQTRCGINTEI